MSWPRPSSTTVPSRRAARVTSERGASSTREPSASSSTAREPPAVRSASPAPKRSPAVTARATPASSTASSPSTERTRASGAGAPVSASQSAAPPTAAAARPAASAAGRRHRARARSAPAGHAFAQMGLEQHAPGLAERAGAPGRQQGPEALAAVDAMVAARSGRGGLLRAGGVGGQAARDARHGGARGLGIDRLVAHGGDGFVEEVFGLHGASPIRTASSLRSRARVRWRRTATTPCDTPSCSAISELPRPSK